MAEQVHQEEGTIMIEGPINTSRQLRLQLQLVVLTTVTFLVFQIREYDNTASIKPLLICKKCNRAR